MPFFPFSWPFTKIVLMRKKLPDAHIRWTIQFILNHKKANMWRKEKINIEKKNNRTKNPPISTQVIQKKICPFLQPWYPKTKRKKINNKPEKIQKTLWKKWKKACFSLCIKHILKEKTKNENKENISINWRIKQPKERKKKTILHVKRKKNYRIKKNLLLNDLSSIKHLFLLTTYYSMINRK